METTDVINGTATWSIDTCDALAGLRALPSDCVHCVVTSPPYWGLRDYGVEGQLGLERTPAEFVARMVEVFEEVRRVLRPDGTCWMNMGDTYNAHPGQRKTTDKVGAKQLTNSGSNSTGSRSCDGMKAKDLCGVPWQLAFALRDAGWYLRSEIIWHKRSPMPESVRDRPTKAHEQIFLLAKGHRKTRVVPFANLDSERFHLLKHLSGQLSPSPTVSLCVHLSAAILDCPKLQDQLGLPTLDSQVWQERLGYNGSTAIADVPVGHRAALLASRFLVANASTKEFLGELNRLGVTLTDRNQLLVGGVDTEIPLPPGVFGDGKATIGIHDASKVSKVDFSHGSIVMETVGPCDYFYDAFAGSEPSSPASAARYKSGFGGAKSVALVEANKDGIGQRTRIVGSSDIGDRRNARTVWTLSNESFKGAHFATFPTKLVKKCLLLGTSAKGCCPECGAPWRRVVKKKRVATRSGEASKVYEVPPVHPDSPLRSHNGDICGNRDPRRHVTKTKTTGWKPSCECGATDTARCIVLDPFAGAGTALMVARRMDMRAIGFELNPKYAAMARQRIADDAPLFNLAPAQRPPAPERET